MPTGMSTRPVVRKLNPATLELEGEVQATLPAEVPGMIEKARRAEALRSVQCSLADRADEIVDFICRETGKPALEALATEVMNALGVGNFAIDRMEQLFRERKLKLGKLSTMMRYMGRSSYLIPRPLGVVGIITPWNYPLAIPYSQAMMCLAAGNAVVLKPSSQAPLTALRMKKVMVEAGLPADLLQMTVGAGAEVGEVLASSDVDRIIFTGHSDVGRRIMSLAAQRLTPLTLELGGKDAFILLKDADVRRAAKAACWGSFVNCGQTCAAVKRIYIHESLMERFKALFLEEVRSLRQGYDPSDPGITVGPLISETAVKDMEGQVARALEQGAQVLIGGKRPPALKGYFFEPTVVTNVTHDMDLMRQETFGPVVALMTFKDEEEAIRLANDSPFALSGSVWTSDLERGKEFATKLRSGTITVNNVAYTFGLGATPWGGRGESGFGRTHGDVGLEELVERQHVHLDKGRFPSEIWWPPYGHDGKEAMHAVIGLVSNGERGRLLRMLKARRLMRR
jgi:acyl-CoA reductase-like NAD-dependent aldehyde dehydrogenase